MPNYDALIEAALAVRENAHAPYSRFHVGAALLGVDGQIYVGCNVENASYGLTICAERMAIGAAVAAGVTRFEAVAVVANAKAAPCGACRQVLAEFGDMAVVTADVSGSETSRKSLAELLPDQFVFEAPS